MYYSSQLFGRAAISTILTFCALISIFFSGPILRADPYIDLRFKWVAILVGDASNTSDSDAAAAALSISNSAQGYWNTLNKVTGRTYLWSDAPTQYPNQNITTSYTRLKVMAQAYNCPGAPLYANVNLRTDILAGLDWLYSNWYNENTAYGTQSADNNWFAWEIGAPWALEDTMALMYSSLSVSQRTNFQNAIEHWVVEPNDIGTSMGQRWGVTGANRAWKSMVWANLGILKNDTAIISTAASNLSPDFLYATSGDGFYADGSFIQHSAFAYTSGYGFGQLGSAVDLMYLLSGSTWAITDPNKANATKWIYDSFEPNIFRNRIYDHLNGRTVTRYPSADGASSLLMICYKLAQMTSGGDPTRLKAIVKQMIQTDPSFAWSKYDPFSIKALKSIVNDSGVTARGELNQLKFFPTMDRFSLLKPNFAFSVGEYSNTTFNYEAINYENLMGWNSNDGRTILYTNDTQQYGDYWWATVDKYRMPGTTVVSRNPDNINSPEIGSVTLTAGSNNMTDTLADWTKTIDHSSGWIFDTTGSIGGDANRIVRKNDTIEFLDYSLANMTTFSATVFYRSGKSLSNRVFATSSLDNKNFTSVPLTLGSPTALSGGWNQVIVTPSAALPAGTNYLSLEFWMNDSLPSSYGDQNWVGGTVLSGKWGAAGLALHPPGETLTGLKSWFMFDNEIVALGVGVRATEGVPIESIVDNRKINGAGNNVLTVNGSPKPSTLGWNEAMTGVTWAHLAGNTTGSDVGYYFPTATALNGLREARTGSFADESHGTGVDASQQTRNYLTLWVNHGVNPGTTSGVGSYGYVLLPNYTAAQTSSYAASPSVTVLENSEAAQGVNHTTLGVTAVNFWQDQIHKTGIIQANRKSSIAVQVTPGTQLAVSLSEPTMTNTGSVDVELSQAAATGYRADPEINVYQTTPTIRFTANTSTALGKSITAEFNLSSTPTQVISPGMPAAIPAPTIADPMNDWSKVSSHTTGLSFDTANASLFENDSSRARRNTNTTESFVYAVDSALSLTFRMYYISGSAGKYAAQRSDDGLSWTTISLAADSPVVTGSNWNRVNLTANNLPFSTKFVRIQLMNDSLIYSPQIGQVTITHATVPTGLTDPLNDWTIAQAHSNGWYFDSSSATANFNSDYSRLKRAADTVESVTHFNESVLAASATVYFYGAVDGKVAGFTSPDGSTWTSVAVVHDTPTATGSGWYSTLFQPSVPLPTGTKYFRWAVSSDTRIYTPQIGQAYLGLGAFTDSLDSLGYVLGSTANLSFDATNPSYFEGDTSRIRRTTDTAESLTYADPGVYSFSFRAYAIGDFTNKLAAYSSPDGTSWSAVSLTLTSPTATAGGWLSTTVTPATSLPTGTNYVKIQMSNDTRIYAPQIGAITLFRH